MQTRKTYTLEEATKKAEHYCAYQERCHKDVREKLKTWYMVPEAIDLIMVHLLNENFLNETRFAEAFVSGKLRIKKWGRRRLTLELQRKEIHKTTINIALSKIDANEYLDIFNLLAEKKASAIQESNIYKSKKKLIDYLLYRGWESHLIYEKATELFGN
jgi:regulatory protein